MRVFNSFQLVAAYVAWPFAIQWIAASEFKGATAAFYAACAGYVVATWFMVFSVYSTIKND